MAKRNKDEPAKQEPKKKGRCCKRCCLITLIITIVILAAGIGAGCYFGDKILKQQFGASLGETFKVLSNFKNYRKVERNELNNAYQAADSDKFVDSFTTAILLNDNVTAAEVKDALTHVVSETFNDDKSAQSPQESGQTLPALLSDAQQEQDKTATERFLELFTLENMDIERINAFDESNLSDFYLKIKDKELAAFLNEIFIIIVDEANLNAQIKDALSGIIDIDVDLKKIANIEQITFYKSGDTPRMSIVLKAKPREITNPAIESLASADTVFGKDSGNKFLRWAVNAGGTIGKGIANLFFIPKTIYLTADVELVTKQDQETLNPIIKINSTTQKDIETLDKFLNGTVSTQIDQAFSKSGMVGSAITKLNEAVPLDKQGVVDNNTISVDAIQLAFDMLDSSISSSDFIKSMRLLGVNTDEAMIGKPDYKNATFVRDEHDQLIFEDDGEGGMVPKVANAEPGREAALIENDYKSAITDSFEKFFGLSAPFDELMDALFNNETQALTNMFDAEAIKAMINDTENGKLAITDKMMAAIVAYTKDRLLEDVSTDALSLNAFEPRYVSLEVIANTHNIMEVGIQINITEVMTNSLGESNKTMADMLERLIPKSLLIVARIDITPADEVTPFETVLSIDNWSSEKTTDTFNSINRILSAFGADGFSIDDMVSQLSDGVKKIVDSMNAMLPIKLGESKLVMPNVFDAIASILDINVNGEKMQGSEVKANLKFLTNGYDEASSAQFEGLSQSFLSSLIGFNPMAQFNSKYAVSTSYTFKGLMDEMLGDNFSGNFMDMLDVATLKQLAADSDVYGVEIDERMLYYILDYMLTNSNVGTTQNEDAYDFNIEDVVLVKMSTDGITDFAEITIKLDPQTLIGQTQTENETAEMKLIKEILTDDIFVTLFVDITLNVAQGYEKQSYIYFNGNVEKTESVLDLLEGFGTNMRQNLKNVAKNLEENFDEALSGMNDSGVVEARFETDQFIMSDIFSAIANVVKNEDTAVNGDDMHVVMDCLLNDSDNKVPAPLDFSNYYNDGFGGVVHDADRDDKVTDKVDFEQMLFDEFVRAYPLDGSEAENMTTLTNILSGTTQQGDKEIADIIDSDDFQESVFTQFEQLTGVQIDRLLLSGMIESRWDTIMTEDQRGYTLKYTDMIYSNGRFYVAMAISVPLDSLQLPNDVTDLLIDNNISTNVLVALVVDVTQNLPINEDYDDLVFEINLSGAEKSENVMSVIEKFNKGAVDFNQIGDSVRKVFGDLTDSSGMEFKQTGGDVIMQMPNIFDMIEQMSYKDQFGPNGGKVIQETLQGIHMDSVHNPNSPTAFIRNAISNDTINISTHFQGQINSAVSTIATSPYSTSGTLPLSILDTELGRAIADDANDEDGNGNGFGDIKSFTIVKGTAGEAKYDEETSWINSYYTDGTALNFETDNYSSITFEMQLTTLGGEGMIDLAKKILPEKFYATVVLPFDKHGNVGQSFTHFRINDMTDISQDNLFKLLGTSLSEIDKTLQDNFADCSQAIGDVMTQIDQIVANNSEITPPAIPLGIITLSSPTKSLSANTDISKDAMGKYVLSTNYNFSYS